MLIAVVEQGVDDEGDDHGHEETRQHISRRVHTQIQAGEADQRDIEN